MKSLEWKTYRTRFLVKAKQLTSNLSFIDHLGRQHCGRRGDYLVESVDGVITIAPRQIFEDIYVPMLLPNGDTSAQPQDSSRQTSQRNLDLRFESLKPQRIGNARFAAHFDDPSPSDPNPIVRARRKSVQPAHLSSSRVGLLKTTRGPFHSSSSL